MKQWKLSLVVTLFFALPVQALETDIVERVKDIFPGMDTSSLSDLANINGTLYLGAVDALAGKELWRSDGTPNGTQLVKDIQPGAGNSIPTNITSVNGTLFFKADDGTNGRELWKSDGTQAGTVLVKDINPGGDAMSSFSGHPLTPINGNLLFVADDGINGYELWVTDGTQAGTVMVTDINPGGDAFTLASQFSIVNINGTLYFPADDGTNGEELWTSDGTAAGTMLVKDINTAGDSNPDFLTNVNGTVFFAAQRSVLEGEELWKTDGTEAGTVLVKNINPILAGSSTLFGLTNVNGTLYFHADDGGTGRELWKSDGTPAGTELVKDINPLGNSFPSWLTNFNGTLYFSAAASGNATHSELWKSDGTAAGTVLVRDIAPIGGSRPYSLTNVNGTLYFGADASGMGTNREPWKSDGTEAGTVLVKDINPGVIGSIPSRLTNVNGVLYFGADDGVTGQELYRAYVKTDTPPVFDDVPLSHPFYNVITNFALSGYTSGCSVTPSLYCPNDPVTRAQMAIFLNRGVKGQDFTPEPATGTVFDDVPIGTFADAWIETFKELQITGGCSTNPPLYCPDDPITRSQMAVFLLKVIHGSAYNAPPATGTAFADVSATDFAANWIEQLAKENITGGCGNGDFCPNDAVTRGQMAAFLTRVFHTPMLFE